MRIILAAIAAFFLASAAQATVTTANVNCRIRPAASSSVAERIPRGATVSVVERQRTWSKLRRDRGCWVASRYLGETGARSASSYVGVPRATNSYTRAETRRANRRSFRSSSRRSYAPRRSRSAGYSYGDGNCPCSGSNICVGPRGGRYCITSGGNKRYGL